MRKLVLTLAALAAVGVAMPLAANAETVIVKKHHHHHMLPPPVMLHHHHTSKTVIIKHND